MREFILKRETKETAILVDVGLDTYEPPEIKTSINFFSHLLTAFAFHSGFKVIIEAESRDSDPHHLIEDVAITMGMCIKSALGDKKGINRYASCMLPMDDALVLSAIDISGRPHLEFDLNFKNEMINDMPSDLVRHFFQSLAVNSMSTIHLKQINGIDDHHIAEAAFKAFARALAEASRVSGIYQNRTPSSKGVL